VEPQAVRDERTVPGVALYAVVLGVLVAANLVDRFVDAAVSYLAVPLAAVLVTVLARRAGIGWDELGLARDTWGRGARWAAALAVLVVVVVFVVAAIPAFRSAFVDDRYDDGVGRALLTALVLIPLRTVIAEELIFRGVLLAMLRRRFDTYTAVAVSSVLFGLWHVTSSLGLADENAAVGSLGAGQWIGIVGAVTVTTAAGIILCWLRLRSESLLAPIGAHWAVNGAGVLAAALVVGTS
jgi:tRNA pseudouridine32 synthase/23S rRNA pseudouridine746 synthase